MSEEKSQKRLTLSWESERRGTRKILRRSLHRLCHSPLQTLPTIAFGGGQEYVIDRREADDGNSG
jgi:hypothetical protein